ncbi:tRNA nuclease WapA [Dyella sp. AD56]|uniref:DUF6531 domain-containing protein n=1 Tax=Dyella sp. AD56 TaxID=1528744 RepID=UPI000C841D0F|nr:DUF6531 domain-containing protein [Dyella sp. AD56]PMQ05794.1 tRNA nuclease WapA [Dyella sp. AD56]
MKCAERTLVVATNCSTKVAAEASSRSAKSLYLSALIALGLGAIASTARADDSQYFYILNGDSSVQYSSADDACQAQYANVKPQIIAEYTDASTGSYVVIKPYAGPFPTPGGQDIYSCPTYFDLYNSAGLVSANNDWDAAIQQLAKSCPAGQTLNIQTEVCEVPTDDQDRKETGNPLDPLMGGTLGCVLDPVSAPTGNVYEEEVDYRDADGELEFVRYYNGLGGGGWSNTYGVALLIDPYGRGFMVTQAGGRQSAFTVVNGVVVPETTEQGSLTQVGGQWVYSSSSNEQFTFDALGRLVRWRRANGLAQTLSYTDDSMGNSTATVTDSQGHTLQIVRSAFGIASMTVNGLTVTYTNDNMYRLSKVTKTWGSHTTSRTYLYEDPVNMLSMTGLVDERGVRVATWQYDSQGRAVANSGADGVASGTLAYNNDTSTTVTNALGNAVTYQYQVIQGIKRITAIQGAPAVGCPASNTAYTYTDRGQVASRTDALGTVTTYAYDTLGRETSRVEAKGTPQERTITTTWDPTRFLPLTVTTPDRVTTYTYDDQGRLLSSSAHAVKE